jgi:hypothetical protein
MTITCEQCAYWDVRNFFGNSSICRRNPPGVKDNAETWWPWTNSTDWCGHAVPRDAGGAMAVVEQARALVAEFEREHQITANSIWALRDVLERMKP